VHEITAKIYPYLALQRRGVMKKKSVLKVKLTTHIWNSNSRHFAITNVW
jgi:hypothetical protein